MKEKLKTITFAGLLHDIGKVVYRSTEGYENHSHSGRKFIEDEQINIENKDEILQSISYHHYSELVNAKIDSDHIAYLIYEADNIASGFDRRLDDEKNKQIKQPFNERVPLHSVFNVLNLNVNDAKGAYSLKPPHEMEEINFPKEDIKGLELKTTKSHYSQILQLIKLNLHEMNYQLDSPDSLLKLLEATLTNIPSSTSIKENPDISLYDHLKLTAAIANNMFLYFHENNITNYKKNCFSNNSFRDEESFLLVSGDVSGIQDFIYTISSKGALKSLRGRSFYLEIMLENIIDEILSGLDLNRCHVLYSGGGHFYMLLPNTETTCTYLKNYKEKINKCLLEMFSISLYLELAWVPCSANELGNDLKQRKKNQNLIGEVYSEVSRKISKQKLQRYQNQDLVSLFDEKSSLNALIEEGRECTVCHDSGKLVNYPHEEELNICSTCLALMNLGNKLAKIMPEKNKKPEYIIAISKENRFNEQVPLPAAFSKAYLDILKLKDIEESLKEDDTPYFRVYSLNEFMTGYQYASHVWFANYNKKGGQEGLIDFKELAEKSTGITRIAVMRADVDSLGSTFINGFEDVGNKGNEFNFVSLSRYATLSRHLSMFFKFEVNKLCNGQDNTYIYQLPRRNQWQKNQSEKNLVIVYSGGDDMFVVGAWDEVIEFAIQLRESFKAYTMGRLTLSCGIGLFKESYPINQMAKITGRLEDFAKSNPGKDSVALFAVENGVKEDTVKHLYKWDDFIENVCREKMSKLHKWFYFDESNPERDKLYAGMSLLYKLYELFQRDEEIDIARLAYLLGRLEPSKDDKDKLENYKEMRTALYRWALEEKSRREVLTTINIIVLLNRSGKEENK